jgi:hypothetical protein
VGIRTWYAQIYSGRAPLATPRAGWRERPARGRL